MSQLGLGLAAYGGYQARDREVKAQDYQDRQREYGTAQMDANQPGLADAAAARTAANQLSAAQSNAELGLVPQRAEIASSQLGLQKELLPRQRETARKQVDMQGMQADQDFAQFPQKLRMQLTEGAIQNADAQRMALAKLVDVLDSGSKGQVVQYANGIRSAGIFGDLTGPEISDVRMLKGDDGKERIALIDSSGKPAVALSATDMDNLRAIGRKYDFKTVGKSLVRTDSRGNVTPVYTSPEAMAEKNGHKPAEVATMDWMVQNGVAKDANEAWNKLRTAREKGKAGFIADMMKGSIMPGMGADELRKQEGVFGDMFDRLNGSGRPSASNSNPVNTLDPKVAELFK
ncbi:hypothetical protein [Cupriavidus numazuensis]|uniref:Uncharacterized protein n=1 Tax=Cupriavidus numazuensis TaxID=221992 RepID=A0ABM8TBG6_9BURK|nr:hypothetical protein [Cupriavidus numazuensis]CAG2132572.1 hypothetical protein LMG26411_00640 [Cupriavidus numazuensis]